MKKSFVLFGLSILLAACGGKKEQAAADYVADLDFKQPVNLIFDTDLGPDYDDAGAMAIMHALADSGQVNILAVTASNADENVVPCIEAINAYYGRPNIPVGAVKSEGAVSLTDNHKTKWPAMIAAKYQHPTAKTSDAPDAVGLMRKILAAAPDSSVTICTTGFFTNTYNLLYSDSDQYSPLFGKELIAKKVKRLVCMAGQMPKGHEFNVYSDARSARYVTNEWPTEIIFSGFEIGAKILTGKQLAAMNATNNPVQDIYKSCLAEGEPNGHQSWDITALWVAVKGIRPYFVGERGTFRVTDLQGNNNWIIDGSWTHYRLLPKMSAADLSTLFEKYMMQKPKGK